MKKLFLVLIAFCVGVSLFAQQWGLYTLYSETGSTKTYLVDTAGNTYKTWTHANSYKTGYGAYLVEGDTLVRSYLYSGTSINGGGISGGLQKVTWDGTIAWDWTYSSDNYVLHHDICPLPNGNILCICYDKKSSTEATQAGCSNSSEILSEKIIEVKPIGTNSGVVVWEWYAWDHLCQDYNSSKDNYVSSIVNNPQLFNINYGTEGGFPFRPPPGTDGVDWIHMNGIDYNAELDQIVFSSHYLNEIYIIDHSTTTAEAAGHTGGNSGKGGDLLFRWGNPEAYEASGSTNFDVVHDAHWVPSDNPDFPSYLAAINNEGGDNGKASVDIVNPPIDGYNYDITIGQAYQPSAYTHRLNSTYTSIGQSSSEQLPNGNMLMCIVSSGATYINEVDSDGNSLWSKVASGSVPQAHRYEKCFVRPVLVSLSASQYQISDGESVSLDVNATAITETNPTFLYSWSSTPDGFSGSLDSHTVMPEVTTTYSVTVTNEQSGCTNQASVTIDVNPLGTYDVSSDVNVNIFPNPNDGRFTMNGISDFTYSVLSTGGKVICSGANQNELDVSFLPTGVYYVKIATKDFVKTEKIIIIK